MWSDSESASKNTSNPIFKYPKYSNIRIFENSLAIELVFVAENPRVSLDYKSRISARVQTSDRLNTYN